MTPTLDAQRVEAAARGMAVAAGDDPDKTYAHDMLCTGRDREPLYRWEYWAPLARAAITAYLGDTHVVVPREPTEAMLEAGEDTFVSGYTGTPTSSPEDVWKAMLSATPTVNGKGE